MKINNYRSNNTTVYDIPNGHLFRSTVSGCIGWKLNGKFFYLTVPDRYTLNPNPNNITMWDANERGQEVECVDLGRLVSIDEVTVE